MLYIVLFTDNPQADPNIRKDHMSDHLAFLEAHSDKILSAGPLIEADQSVTSGLWIVETGTRQEVENLIYLDPFWPTGLRESFQIKLWRQVFKDGIRQI